MKGLFLYYLEFVRKKILLLVSILFIVILISISESVHELVLLYLNLLPMILISYDNEQRQKNNIFEKIIPVKSSGVVVVKYLLSFLYLTSSLFLSYLYIKCIGWLGISINYTELFDFMLFIWCLAISVNLSILISSNFSENEMKKYLFFLFPAFQSINLSLLGNFLIAFFFSFLFLILSFSICIKLQRSKKI